MKRIALLLLTMLASCDWICPDGQLAHPDASGLPYCPAD